MRLTNYSDYALRTLIYLAVKPSPNALANINDIADSYQISKSHLTKIVHQLGKLGYIESVRGKGGGIRLSMHPRNINIGELIRHTESDFNILDCLTDPTPDGSPTLASKLGNSSTIPSVDITADDVIAQSCVISPVCQLKGVFSEAMLAFIKVLDGYTLADVISNADELLEYL
ncbi:Rrf2 family transcriptional regulator [Moraxella caviae]|uniref:HTH-type transcriptional repressor NsrR n=1 Tax=Moraxella caviae TaxID=34060 RepID=A0A1T0ABY5_9GAMM|nr:Rrf2 family transcriptional regulator [Moraxella caviae]OOR93178.1 Rrf2 family transcriptional regulator [Moraxella caviae]STZ10448.1 HTH-type transcriptional repressor NsrR [Moraxella caviae]